MIFPEPAIHPLGSVEENVLKYAVICARYRGRWIFCRHKDRCTWELPGGHIEPGETGLGAARRELYEETGAVEADILPVCIYKLFDHGLLCFAEVRKLAPIPESSEIRDVQIHELLPDALTYAGVHDKLFEWVQGWLNIRSNTGELWDVYDRERKPTGRTHRRGDFLPEGDYHLVVHVWIQNSLGQFLLTKRSPNKGFPNMWETTGGSALAGEDSLTAALREVREETGLVLFPENGSVMLTDWSRDRIVDIWLFRQDFTLEAVKLQEGETCDKMLVDKAEILSLRDDKKLVPYPYLDNFFAGI